MSNREFGVSALGRFLAVERYRETCLYPSTDQVARRDLDRAGSHRPDRDQRRFPGRGSAAAGQVGDR